MVLKLSLYSSQSLWWHSDYPHTNHSLPIGSDNPYTHHSLPGGTQTIHLLISYSGGPQTIPILITVFMVAQAISILITVSLVVLRLSLYSSQTPWWHTNYPFTDHSLSGGPKTNTILITVYLVAQTISILITVSLMVLRLSLYSSQSLWWYSEYPYTHHSQSSCWSSAYTYSHHIMFGGTQTNLIRITVSLVVLRISLYSLQSPWWYSDYPYTHQSP